MCFSTDFYMPLYMFLRVEKDRKIMRDYLLLLKESPIL